MSRPTCYVENCNRSHHGQGLCKYHYTKQRRAALKNRAWEVVQVDSAPLRKRINKFLSLGYNYAMLEALSGVDRSTLHRSISKNRKTVVADNVEALERVPLTPLYHLWRTDIGVDYKVPAYLAARRIRALMSMGYTTTRIAEESGLTRQTISRVALRNTSEEIVRSNLVKINDAYNRLWDQEAPTPYHHSELTKYNHWPLPLEWDDDEIDLPKGYIQAERAALRRHTLDNRRQAMRDWRKRQQKQSV